MTFRWRRQGQNLIFSWPASIPIIGRELSFLIDVDLLVLPQLTRNDTQSTVDCLFLTDFNRHFSSSVFKISIEDHRESHDGGINNNRCYGTS